jgi:hypothetical protein
MYGGFTAKATPSNLNESNPVLLIPVMAGD